MEHWNDEWRMEYWSNGILEGWNIGPDEPIAPVFQHSIIPVFKMVDSTLAPMLLGDS